MTFSLNFLRDCAIVLVNIRKRSKNCCVEKSEAFSRETRIRSTMQLQCQKVPSHNNNVFIYQWTVEMFACSSYIKTANVLRCSYCSLTRVHFYYTPAIKMGHNLVKRHNLFWHVQSASNAKKKYYFRRFLWFIRFKPMARYGCLLVLLLLFFHVQVMHKMQIDADAMAHYIWNRDHALN